MHLRNLRPQRRGRWHLADDNYPGIGVDTPSAYYSLSREVNPDWSSYYPQGAEYQAYLVALADKHRLARATSGSAPKWKRSGGTRTRAAGRSTRVDAAGDTRRHPCPRGRDGRRLPEPASLAGRAGPGHVRGHQHSLRALGSHAGPRPASGWRSSAPDAPPCRSSTRVSTQVEHLTVFQRQPHWVAPRKRLTDEVPDHRRYLGRTCPYYANWHRLKSYWGTADNNYPIILQDPEWAKTHLSIYPANDVLLQMCLDYIDRTFGAGTELAQKVTPGLRALRQADHPRSRGLLRGVGACARRRRGQRTRRGQRQRHRHQGRPPDSTSTSSCTPPDTTWTSCPPSTFAGGTARGSPTSGATARGPTAVARSRDSRTCSSRLRRTTARDTVQGPTSRWSCWPTTSSSVCS